MEFKPEQWAGLKSHAEDKGLVFISSPFSIEAVDLLIELGVKIWKVASGEVSTSPIIDRIINTGLSILLSTGMSSLGEIDTVVNRIKTAQIPLTVMQCTSAYPCPPEKVGLNMISFFRQRYGCPVGLSDHSGTIYAGLAAATLGINALEVHVTLSREMFGPDVPASITSKELSQLAEGVRFIECMRANPADKDHIAAEMAPIRSLFTKSIVARLDLPAGTLLREEHLDFKKPGTGIAPERLPELLGCRLRYAVKSDEMILEDNLEEKNAGET